MTEIEAIPGPDTIGYIEVGECSGPCSYANPVNQAY